MVKTKTFFITGGAGFIGFFIIQKLMEDEKNKVIIFDNYKNYDDLEKLNYPKYLKYRMKVLVKFRKRITWIRGDITNKKKIKTALKKYTPDIIIHLAAVPVANVCNENPLLAKRVILDGTINLLDCIKELNLKTKMIYTSSSMVYGHFLKDKLGNVLPAVENQNCEPVNIYGAMKLAGEYIVKVYSKIYKIPYSIIRPSAVYGPTDCNRRVTEIFLIDAIAEKEIILNNGGLNQLDFTYVEDIADGFVLVANSDKAIGETFNITRGEGKTLKDLSSIISQLISDTKVIIKEIKTNLPERGELDIAKANKILNYNPKYSLEEGIKKYWEFIQKEKEL